MLSCICDILLHDKGAVVQEDKGAEIDAEPILRSVCQYHFLKLLQYHDPERCQDALNEDDINLSTHHGCNRNFAMHRARLVHHIRRHSQSFPTTYSF
jgi:hypothetical protein